MTETQIRKLTSRLSETEYGTIRTFALRLVRNHALAEEFTQEAVLHLLEHEKKTGQEIEKTKPWLYRTIRNLIFDWFRRQKKHAEICACLTYWTSEHTPASASEEVQKKENTEMLLQKLDQLPLRHREAVRLKFQEELTYEEIAEVLGISRAGVGRLLSEVLGKLREMLKDGE